jgi:hypothetical protein
MAHTKWWIAISFNLHRLLNKHQGYFHSSILTDGLGANVGYFSVLTFIGLPI